MNTTYDRKTLVRSGTADLSRKTDDILDRRFAHAAPKDALVEEEPKDPNPMALVRTLIKGIGRK